MRFWIGVTDQNWYEYLASRQPDEVNFWRPSSATTFHAIEWSPFLFKLHSPANYIVGGAFFVRYMILPLWLTWESFEDRNGTTSIDNLRAKISKYRGREVDLGTKIGCILLAEPFFFDREDWIPQPEDWSSNIVAGKTYDTDNETGSFVWAQVEERLRHLVSKHPEIPANAPTAVETYARYGAATLVRPRLGQGTFRTLVTEAYNSRCAVTNERTLPALQAAHIKPYAQTGPHEVRNGVLLRADIHQLFEHGYMTITHNYQIEVSSRIKEEFENGRDYYIFQGHQLASIPANPNDQPAPEYVDWHNTNIFKS